MTEVEERIFGGDSRGVGMHKQGFGNEGAPPIL